MIGKISGILLAKNPPQILVDVGGIGYELDVPMSTFYSLPEKGQQVMLITHQAVRDDMQLLFGFLSNAERSLFRRLLKVSGIGARSALAILSAMSASDLASDIARQEIGRLTKIPGIGKKTAERVMLELRDKLPDLALSQHSGSRDASAANATAGADILNALLALGYHEREARSALRIITPGGEVADGVRQALQHLSKA